jgi:hypothetical protein
MISFRKDKNKIFRSKLALSLIIFLFSNIILVENAFAAIYSFQNAKLRFGTGSEDSLNSLGTMQQPFYKSGSAFYKLTFSTYPLDIAIGTGGVSNGSWNTNGTIVSTSGNSAYTVTSHSADYSGFISTPAVAANSGYGVITSTDNLTIATQNIQVVTKYSLGINDAFIKIETTVKNLSATSLTNLRTWVGTRDDWVGSSDQPTKTRGNITNGAFTAISSSSTQSQAIQINSGSEGVLFYSSNPKAQTSVNACCQFSKVVAQDPATAAISITNDGSYTLFMAMNDLASGATSETLTWYYAAGATADLASIVTTVSAANLTLSNLTISAGSLSPTFNSSITSYTDTVTANISSLTVTPTATDSGVATIKVKANSGAYATVSSGTPSQSLSMNVGLNTVYVQVTGGDSSTAVTTVSVFRPETPVITLTPTYLSTTKTFIDTLTVGISTSVYSPTGTFKFTENGTNISGCTSVSISVGSALCRWVPSSSGTKTLVATYSGDTFVGLNSETRTVVVNELIAITSDTSTIIQKYGSSQTKRVIAYTGGSDTKVVTASANSLASGKIIFSPNSSTLSIDTRTAVGTYYETITVTDAINSFTSYVQTISITPADTLTIIAETQTAVTYTGSAANVAPTASAVSGLVSGDLISDATYTYSASATSCANGGICSVGDIGPSGGYVFYVSPTAINVASGISTGGIYLEAAPLAAQGTAQFGCTGTSTPGTSYSVGSGAANTLAIINSCATAGITARVTSNLTYAGFSDWFMPSLDEMTAIYNNLYNKSPSLGGFTGVDYGSSSEGSNGFGYQAYWWFGAGAISGQTNKNYVAYYRPIRAFNPISTSNINYGPSTTKPTNAGSYTLTPSALTFSSGALENYVSVKYVSSMFTINKAPQANLVLTSSLAVFTSNPSTLKLTTVGGSDTGTVTYSVAAGGSATGCTLVNDSLSASTYGTCLIIATKAETNNYLLKSSDTATVTFSIFVGYQQTQTQSVPTQLPINGQNSLDVTQIVTVPAVTGVFLVNSTYEINGTGFTGVNRVVIGGSEANIISSTSTKIVIDSAGLMPGPLFIECSDGRIGPSPFYFFAP